jgi:Calcineurin-like phosphoesterase
MNLVFNALCAGLALRAAAAFPLSVRKSVVLQPLHASSHDFTVGVLGDLHIDPRKMEDYEIGRNQWSSILEEAKAEHGNVAVVSLGDLGESKSVRPEETAELFAGTTECHEMAAEFLGSFGVPYELVGGNHGKIFHKNSNFLLMKLLYQSFLYCCRQNRP